MLVVFIDFLLAIFVAALGVAAGWWFRGHTESRSDTDDDKAAAAREMVARLRELATGMAADVDEHSSRVREINDELASADSDNPDDVVAAITKLIAANHQMHERLNSAENKLHEQAQQLEESAAEARTDALTSLANRRAFDDAIHQAQTSFRDHGRPTTVMMIDVDHFKKFNDTHGHQAGDAVLRGVARVLRQSVSKTEIVARYGGEEFSIIFPGSNVVAATPAAERARAAIADSMFEFEGVTLRVTASTGLAEFRPGENGVLLVKRADEALYASKKAGRNCGHWHDGAESHPLAIPAVKTPAPVKVIAPAKATEKPSPKPAAAGFSFDGVDEVEAPDADRCDPITGLSNRTTIREDVNRRIAEWKRGGATVSLMFVQIDGYGKMVADEGQPHGDLLLRASTQFLKAATRDMDHVARYDDDTFAVLLPGAALSDSIMIGERLRRAIASCEVNKTGMHVRFTVSLGITEAVTSDSSTKMLERSQAALDAAIKAGRNRSFYHDGEVCEAAEAAATAKVGV